MNILNFLSIYLKYFLLLIFLYCLGRAFFIILSRIFINKTLLSKSFFETNINIFYPIFGVFFLGNVLNLINFFLPLKSNLTFFIIFLLLLSNLLELNKNFKFKIQEVLLYLFVPFVLVFSFYDINFHYDAGYYHLGHQQWLRESNIIFGFVNIFWPYGISSIYEYIGSFLLIDSSFQSLHSLNLIFIATLYYFIGHELFLKKQSVYFYPSIFLLIFAFLDNFGFSGGRNGFLYIEGITAFDTPVGVVFLFFCLFMFIRLKDKTFVPLELIASTSLIIFLVQMKLSTVIVSLMYLFYLSIFIKNSNYPLKKILFFLTPNIVIYCFWLIKNVLTTGCLIFPLSLTCFSNFSWYLPESTEQYQYITTEFSGSYNLSSNIFVWAKEFYSIDINRVVLLNFVISFLFVFLLSKFFFLNKKTKNTLIYIFLISNLVFLIFFGPIPRYAIGFLMFCVCFIGFKVQRSRINIPKSIYLFFFVISLVLIPRVNSYLSFIDESVNLSLPYIELIQVSERWTSPIPGEDQCWLNQFCSAEREGLVTLKDGFFQTAYREK